MSGFIELKLPEQGGLGWFISTKSDKPEWLSIHGDITSDVSDTSIFYFATEGDAMHAATVYYKKHGLVFMHPPVLKSENVEKTLDNESQVMRFT